jgi:hypothetical protein
MKSTIISVVMAIPIKESWAKLNCSLKNTNKPTKANTPKTIYTTDRKSFMMVFVKLKKQIGHS